MAKAYSLKHERLLELLHYEPTTGLFTRRIRAGTQVAGSVAGHTDGVSYNRVSVDSVIFLSHRLVWFYVYKVWPDKDIDHINRIKSDNRIANLRDVDRFTNLQNMGCMKNSRSGLKGISRHIASGKWQVHLSARGVRVYVGLFSDLDLAKNAYEKAALEHHPESFKLNLNRQI